ncbi:pyruvate dehydrogenase complex dihydrolipoamide acetyltransferase [Candidatus Puniceispirillum sp.]|nr:pyruvate dehydrogenase complex dihydrolipoamide acetyltransferase [Candidatus Puniceispirillum sp.]
MATEIKMPALSPTMTTGILAKWLVGEGDQINSGDVIAEIETDKATMEVESVDDGIMAKILIEAGRENVSVGEVIAVLAEDGETADDVANNVSDAPQPAARPPAALRSMTSVPERSKPSLGEPRIFSSPLARRIAADKGVALDGITGSGPHGRILRRDVETAKALRTVKPALSSSFGGIEALVGGQQGLKGDSYLVPNGQMRKVIADRLQRSKQQAPHFYLTVDCMIDTLLDARKVLNVKAPDDVKISLNDMIIRAAAMALIAVPEANASWEGDHTRRFHNANISMAVAVEGGLITPIIWAAEETGLAALSRITKDLAQRARDGQLAAEEYTGGSFTISNLGMFGIREFAAVINPPQGAILAVGVGEKRPVVIDGGLAVATLMTVTLSADHRAVDGAVGAKWLQAFRGFIENPVTMLL